MAKALVTEGVAPRMRCDVLSENVEGRYERASGSE
jgi:hypothetical protein